MEPIYFHTTKVIDSSRYILFLSETPPLLRKCKPI